MPAVPEPLSAESFSISLTHKHTPEAGACGGLLQEAGLVSGREKKGGKRSQGPRSLFGEQSVRTLGP